MGYDGSMETLELLGVALGLSALCGINLYLTVFAAGLAVRMGWIALAPQYEQLAVLGDPFIIAVAGIFFLFEFFADKVPWVDSVWDAVHTVIRPVGAAFLAITVLGDPSPVFDVIVGLLAGGTALTTHAIKATGRLVVNASPEPFSNIGLSLAEDGAVIGGLFLLAWNPLVGLLLVVLGLATAWFLAPRIFRLLASRLRFAWKKLTFPAETKTNLASDFRVPVDVDCALHREASGPLRVSWCLPVTSGKLSGTPANVPGWLITTQGDSRELFWAGRVFFRLRLVPLQRELSKFDYKSGFLFDKVTLYNPETQRRVEFLVDRGTARVLHPLLEEFFRPASGKSDGGSAAGMALPERKDEAAVVAAP
jgi:hypothetical protein